MCTPWSTSRYLWTGETLSESTGGATSTVEVSGATKIEPVLFAREPVVPVAVAAERCVAERVDLGAGVVGDDDHRCVESDAVTGADAGVHGVGGLLAQESFRTAERHDLGADVAAPAKRG